MYMRRGTGQYENAIEGITVDTSGVQIVAPTFVGPCPIAGQEMNPQTGACITATQPTPYIAPSSSTAAATMPSLPSWLIPAAIGTFIAIAFLGARR